MIKVNEWNNYVSFNEVPDNGIFICQPTDAVLDSDCWPIWLVVMRDAVIVHQETLYSAPHGGYQITDMMGWAKVQFIEWAQYEEHTTGAEQSNNFMWVGDEHVEEEEKAPYWFCVKVDDPTSMYRAMTILGFYKVQMEVIVDGENPEFLLVNGDTREGDLVFAEMAFSAPGDVVWYQAKVCPICENNGESICGHMYFTDPRETAF